MSGTWQSKPFDQCIDRVKYSSKIPRSEFLEFGTYPIVSQEADFINGYWDKEEDVFKVDRPLVVFGDHTQVLKYVDFDFVIGADGTKLLSPKSFLYPKYFYYFLMSLRLKRLGYARHYRLLSEISVVYPPLPEQKRIVAMLDETFEGIAAAVANAEKNLANVKELFDGYLQAAFANPSATVPLSNLALEITDGDHSPPPKAQSGIPFITISNIVKATGAIDFSDTFSVPEEYFRNLKPNKRPRRGDVLYTVTGATLGIPVLVREDRDFCFQRHIGLIRPTDQTDSDWLTYALRSPQAFKQATDGSTGAAQKTVSLKVLRGLTVPKLALSEQKRVAGLLDEISVETQHLASIYERKIAALAELKQGILQKAFAGELTAQPDKALPEAAE